MKRLMILLVLVAAMSVMFAGTGICGSDGYTGYTYPGVDHFSEPNLQLFGYEGRWGVSAFVIAPEFGDAHAEAGLDGLGDAEANASNGSLDVDSDSGNFEGGSVNGYVNGSVEMSDGYAEASIMISW